jgi:hypothetical protein
MSGFVQATTVVNMSGDGTTGSVAFGTNVVAGDALLILIGLDDNDNGNITLPSTLGNDSQGNSYSKLYQSNPTNVAGLVIYGTIAASSGACTLNVNNTTLGNARGGWVGVEYNGLTSSIGSLVEASASAYQTSGTSLTVGPASNANVGDIVLAVFFNMAGSDTGGWSVSGYTKRVDVTVSEVGTSNIGMADLTTTGTGANSPAFSGLASTFTAAAVLVLTVGVTQAATPTMTSGSGTFSNPKSITLACSTPGSSIYYTTDGSTPTNGSTLYSAPFNLIASATVKCIAYAPGYSASNVASTSYALTVFGTVSKTSIPGGYGPYGYNTYALSSTSQISFTAGQLVVVAVVSFEQNPQANAFVWDDSGILYDYLTSSVDGSTSIAFYWKIIPYTLSAYVYVNFYNQQADACAYVWHTTITGGTVSVDTSSTGQGTGTTASVANYNTSGSDELIFSAVGAQSTANSSSFWTQGAGETSDSKNFDRVSGATPPPPNFVAGAQHRILSAPATGTSDSFTSTSIASVMASVAFKGTGVSTCTISGNVGQNVATRVFYSPAVEIDGECYNYLANQQIIGYVTSDTSGNYTIPGVLTGLNIQVWPASQGISFTYSGAPMASLTPSGNTTVNFTAAAVTVTQLAKDLGIRGSYPATMADGITWNSGDYPSFTVESAGVIGADNSQGEDYYTLVGVAQQNPTSCYSELTLTTADITGGADQFDMGIGSDSGDEAALGLDVFFIMIGNSFNKLACYPYQNESQQVLWGGPAFTVSGTPLSSPILIHAEWTNQRLDLYYNGVCVASSWSAAPITGQYAGFDIYNADGAYQTTFSELAYGNLSAGGTDNTALPYLGCVSETNVDISGGGAYIGHVKVISSPRAGVPNPYLGKIYKVTQAPGGNITDPLLGEVTIVADQPGPSDIYIGHIEET